MQVLDFVLPINAQWLAYCIMNGIEDGHAKKSATAEELQQPDGCDSTGFSTKLFSWLNKYHKGKFKSAKGFLTTRALKNALDAYNGWVPLSDLMNRTGHFRQDGLQTEHAIGNLHSLVNTLVSSFSKTMEQDDLLLVFLSASRFVIPTRPPTADADTPLPMFVSARPTYWCCRGPMPGKLSGFKYPMEGTVTYVKPLKAKAKGKPKAAGVKGKDGGVAKHILKPDAKSKAKAKAKTAKPSQPAAPEETLDLAVSALPDDDGKPGKGVSRALSLQTSFAVPLLPGISRSFRISPDPHVSTVRVHCRSCLICFA